jgi:hypothetical protein
MADRRTMILQIVAWGGFLASLVAAFVFGESGVSADAVVPGHLAFIILSIALATWAVSVTQFKRASLAIATVGVAVSQWRLIELLLLLSIWSVTGFAP